MTGFLAKHGLILGLAVFVLAAGKLFVMPEPVVVQEPDLEIIPLQKDKYTGEDIESEVSLEEQLGTEHVMMRYYWRSTDAPVNLCLVYNYARRSTSFHDPWICFPAQGWTLQDMGKREIKLQGKVVQASLLSITRNNRSQLVLYWYMSGENPVDFAGSRQGDLKTMVESRLNKKLGVSSMVRVSQPIEYGDIEATYQNLEQFLQVMYPDIEKIEADIEYPPMPAKKLWASGIAGQAGIVAALVVPIILAMVGVSMLRTNGAR